MSEHILKINNLSRSYLNTGTRVDVLKGINCQIARNDFLAIQGPSGAGKSTLLHILGGLDKPSSGEVIFEGDDIYKISDNRRALLRNRKIGFVFQFYHLLPELSALENVLMPCFLRSWWEKKKSLSYAKSLFSLFGLEKRMQHKPKHLSGGEQQRVAVMRALINRPAVLLCDEPTGNLDSENGKKIMDAIKRVHKEEDVTVVLVTHDTEIAECATLRVQLKDGIILN
ncbi:MAG: ABC transporter ATP-binding protein [Candidatus Omnitrophica bacterium]|jgi:ABC-type lipoprotein export system ATPase subunit|nr:ABC transporter ATP-binding protein [Candidatus Omnitrophota bacterium]